MVVQQQCFSKHQPSKILTQGEPSGSSAKRRGSHRECFAYINNPPYEITHTRVKTTKTASLKRGSSMRKEFEPSRTIQSTCDSSPSTFESSDAPSSANRRPFPGTKAERSMHGPPQDDRPKDRHEPRNPPHDRSVVRPAARTTPY
ncbi:hypothetical protein KM043_012592 [Ampulex compressa]|nr:hypothetical protein KM043_012592 [Ampulex compressa]